MHYYPFNLKDYLVQTAHLPPLADLAYRRLLDLYYLEESPIPNKPKWVANRIRLDSEEAIIGFVLREYFELRGTGPQGFWHHDTCDRVIAKYQKKVAVARENGAQHVAGTKKEPKSDADRSPTKNHKPRRNTPLPPEGVVVVFDEFWNAHPRKVGKPKALAAFAAAVVRGAKPEDILAGLKRHLPTWNAKKAEGDGDKIPHPTTWLNRDGWNDEVMPEGQRPGDGQRTDWWETKQGVLDRGLQLAIPAPADEHPNTWAQFKAAVWVAAGEGPWWDKTSVAYPIAVRLRDQANDVTALVMGGMRKEGTHA